MNGIRKHVVFISITSIFLGAVVFFYFLFSSQVVSKNEPFELIPANTNWILVLNEQKLSVLDQTELNELTKTNFPLQVITEYFNQQKSLQEMNCWVFEVDNQTQIVLPDGKSEKAVTDIIGKLSDWKVCRSNGFVIISKSEYKPIEAEQSIQSDEAFFCAYDMRSSDANFCFLIKFNAEWELWEQFKRSDSMQLSRMYCSVGQPDSLKSEFMAIGQIPTDAVDLWDRHFGNGKLLLDVSFQEADSTKQKFFIECEVEHESSLGTSFVDWFSENATGEIGSFRMKNLGSDRIHFVGINQNSIEKWFADSSSQVIKKFPLGSRLMLNGNVSADSTCFGFIQQGNLYFSHNSKVLSGLKDYLVVCSKMESSTEFKSLPSGGEIVIHPQFDSPQIQAINAQDSWFHCTHENGYVKWIQLAKSSISKDDLSNQVQAAPIVSDEPELIFKVENHLTSKENEIQCYGNKLQWKENGEVRFEFECKSKIHDLKQIDQFGNGKLQVLILTEGGLDLCDINGTRLAGFPIAVPQCTQGVWCVTQERKPELCRILVASGSNEIFNYRVNGQPTSGWQKPKFEMQIKSIHELTNGYEIQLADGSKTQLKKTGVKLK